MPPTTNNFVSSRQQKSNIRAYENFINVSAFYSKSRRVSLEKSIVLWNKIFNILHISEGKNKNKNINQFICLITQSQSKDR